jgi:NitT/TauT family transport system ATP-binding protein
LKENRLNLTAAGRVFAEADTGERKRVFKEHLLCFVPLAANIKRILDERAEHSAPRLRFEMELEDHLSRAEAEKTLRSVIDWGRYAEIFGYDDRRKKFMAVTQT